MSWQSWFNQTSVPPGDFWKEVDCFGIALQGSHTPLQLYVWKLKNVGPGS